jgi:hypothetical protein
MKMKLLVVVGLLFLMLITAGPGHAKVGPDQDLSDFPPWIWPIIRTVSVLSKAISATEVEFDQLSAQMKEAVLHQCECLNAGDHDFKEIMAMVNAQFDVQRAVLKTAKTKAAGFGMKSMVALDDDDWCGTPPKPRPWPWPPFLMDLVKLQADLFRTELGTNFKLSEEESKLFDANLNSQMEAFGALLR